MVYKTLLEQKDELLSFINAHTNTIGFNETIFEILEGNLLKHVEESLEKQLSGNSYNTAKERVAPINLLRKTTDKLSSLYVEDPKRKTPIESDQQLVDEYTQEIAINTFMEDLNKAYNAYKWSVMEFYIDEGIKTRVIPSHQFLPYGNDLKNPLKITAIIKFMGEIKKVNRTVRKYWVYSKDEFLAIDSDGELVVEDMTGEDGLPITNSFGVLPFVFISKSRYLLVPMPDKDDLKMAILFPVLLTDLNFAAKFLAHSIFYGIDIDAENLKLSPDAVWLFKSNDEGKAPEVGTITPQVSIEEVLSLAKEQVASWLETKNIKVGSIGSGSTGNSVSGIAKMVDESDTTKERKSQEKFFKMVELAAWRVIAQMHNTLVSAGQIKGRKIFTKPEKLIVNITYSEPKPIISRREKVESLKLETEAKFKSRRTAIKELNPDMTDDDVDNEMAMIENETIITISEDSNAKLDE